MSQPVDAVVVGSGPNGLAAAITLAAAGRSVVVLEARATVGGGLRSAELIESGFVHDVCAGVHPLAVASPSLRAMPLAAHGLAWRHPVVDVAHPLDGGRAGVARRDLPATVDGLGADGTAYLRLVEPVVDDWGRLASEVLGPMTRLPRHPIALARFGFRALPPATWLAKAFGTDEARGLLAGAAAHAIVPLGRPLTGAAATLFAATVHIGGWPVVEGGSGRLAEALAGYLRSLGGSIECGVEVRSMSDLPRHRVALFDTDPGQLASIAESAIGVSFANRLRRFRHGPGAFKIDYTLGGPVPWTSEACRSAGTVHVGGTFEEVAAAESDVARGRHPERPFVLVAQQSVVDPTRAPAGCHTLWAYCHVPTGSQLDMTGRIEAQIERFAPGFSDLVRGRHVTDPAGFAAYNPNYVGGDIAGGSAAGLGLILRPRATTHPYQTPDPSVLLCSASTPPGAGVHGMCGHHAARVVLATVLRG